SFPLKTPLTSESAADNCIPLSRMKIETNANAALIFISACQLRRVRLSLLRGFSLPQPTQLLNGSTFQLLSNVKPFRSAGCLSPFLCTEVFQLAIRGAWDPFG